jgi:DHA2 family multidrug resistance protein
VAADALIRPVGEPSRRDWIAVMSAMLGAFMAVLDIQITNSSLKDIQGAPRWRKAPGFRRPIWSRKSS